MRICARQRLLTVGLLAVFLAVPAVAGANQNSPPKDGSLALEDGKGLVQINAKGTILGQLHQGKIVVTDEKPFDSARPQVKGYKWRLRKSRTTVVYGGRDLRYRLAGGAFKVKVTGLGIDLSAVGRGSVTLQGDARYADTGLYSLNGAEFAPVPYERTTLKLAAAPATG